MFRREVPVRSVASVTTTGRNARGHGTPGTGAALRRVLGAPFTVRTRAELAHCLLGLPLALAGFLPVAVFLALGAGLTVSLLGAALGLLLIVTAIGPSPTRRPCCAAWNATCTTGRRSDWWRWP